MACASGVVVEGNIVHLDHATRSVDAAAGEASLRIGATVSGVNFRLGVVFTNRIGRPCQDNEIRPGSTAARQVP